MQVDKNTILTLSKDKTKKSEFGKDNLDIRANMYPFSKEFLGYIETLTTYEIAAIILDNQNWISSRKSKPITYSYHSGEIVMVNLGATNYGYELGYYHPAVIWQDLGTAVLIIPCTSTFKQANPYIVTADQTHGFKNTTTIMLDKLRIVDKRRIKGNKKGGVISKLSKDKLDEIRDLLLSTYFQGTISYIKKLKIEIENKIEESKNLNNEFLKLEEENGELNKKIRELEMEIINKNKKLTELKKNSIL